jgi:hypothetical protein
MIPTPGTMSLDAEAIDPTIASRVGGQRGPLQDQDSSHGVQVPATMDC